MIVGGQKKKKHTHTYKTDYGGELTDGTSEVVTAVYDRPDSTTKVQTR